MKTQIFKSQYATYFLDEANSILIQEWNNYKNKMSDDEYKNDMLNFLKFVEKHKTKKALINTETFGYAITPEMQTWIDRNIAIKTNKIVKKIAFIMPVDIFEKVSIEQTMSEKEGSEYNETKFFEHEDTAIEWLLL